MGIKTPVRCVETGEVFESMTDAGLSVGKNYLRVETGHGDISSHTNISGCIQGRQQTAGGYHWELVGSPITSTTPISGYNSLKRTEDKLPKIYKLLKRKAPKQPQIDYPPEGYVYIFRNRWHPENVYKIGSTDNLEARRATARTWGPYECVHYLEVGDCKAVESRVHDILEPFRVVENDLGEEHFKVDLGVAITAIGDAYMVDLRRVVDSLPRIAA